MINKPYSSRFLSRDEAYNYENREYSPGSYSSYIWQLQKPVILKIIKTFNTPSKRIKLLDFACGTGRVLSFVENEVYRSDGIDVSPTMAELANNKCTNSRIIVGDILENPTLLEEDYDIVTCFRFILNAETDTRIKVLQALRKKLIMNNGILIANVHGNSHSIRSLALIFRILFFKEQHNQMSRKEIKKMFQASGFRIKEEYGFGILPPTLYRTPFKSVAMWVDKLSSKIPLMNRFSIDLLYLCQLYCDTDKKEP